MSGQQGQTTVETALLLPAVAFLMGVIVEVGLLTADDARLWHAAREGARVAAVDADADDVEDAVAAAGMTDASVEIAPIGSGRTQGDPVTVRLAYDPRPHVPLVGHLFGGIRMSAQATMRIERP